MTDRIVLRRSGLAPGFEVDSTKKTLTATPIDNGSWAFNVLQLSPFDLVCETDRQPLIEQGSSITIRLEYGSPSGDKCSVKGIAEKIEGVGSLFIVTIRVDQSSKGSLLDMATLIESILKQDGFQSTGDSAAISEKITDSESVKDVVHSLIADNCQGMIIAQGTPPEIRRIIAMRYDPDYHLPIQWKVDSPWPKEPREIEMQSYNSVYRFAIGAFEECDGLFAMDFPEELTRFRTRMTRRVQTDSIRVSFQHPVLGDVRVEHHTVDVSQNGLSFCTETGIDWLCPGMSLPAIIVSAGKRSTLLQGIVRHVTYSQNEDHVVCGIEIECPSPFHHKLGWAHMLEPLLHPDTERGTEENAEEVWRVYRDSGYFNLSGKSPEDFEPLRDDFKSVWRHFGSTPAVGCQALWRSGDHLEATLSVMLMYSKTWLLSQLGRRKGRPLVNVSGRELVRDLYVQAFEHAQWYPTLEWMLTFAEANIRWNNVTYYEFAKQYEHTGKVYNIPFRLMEDRARSISPARSPRYEIAEATLEEMEIFFEHVRKIYPLALVEALDYTPSQFYLDDVNATLVAADLHRKRKLFILRREGLPIAGAVFETGTLGMHLFRLVDSVRLFSFEVDADEDALFELIEFARGWYSAQGRDVFVYFIEEWQRSLAEKAGFSDLGEGRVWLIHASLASDFMEFIHRLTAPRNIAPLPRPVPGTGSESAQ